jgi:hypothetical protein
MHYGFVFCIEKGHPDRKLSHLEKVNQLVHNTFISFYSILEETLGH